MQYQLNSSTRGTYQQQKKWLQQQARSYKHINRTPTKAREQRCFDGAQSNGGPSGDPNFAKIDPESDQGLGGTTEGVFGEKAMLLVGTTELQLGIIMNSLAQLCAEDEVYASVKVIICTEGMMRWTLKRTVEIDYETETDDQDANVSPDVIFFSGLSSQQVVKVITALNSQPDFLETLYAAAVPLNYQKTLRELVDEIQKDDQLMRSGSKQEPKKQ